MEFTENRYHEDPDFDHVRLLRAVILVSLSYASPQSDSFRPTADTIMDDPVVGRVNESVPRISLTAALRRRRSAAAILENVARERRVKRDWNWRRRAAR